MASVTQPVSGPEAAVKMRYHRDAHNKSVQKDGPLNNPAVDPRYAVLRHRQFRQWSDQPIDSFLFISFLMASFISSSPFSVFPSVYIHYKFSD